VSGLPAVRTSLMDVGSLTVAELAGMCIRALYCSETQHFCTQTGQQNQLGRLGREWAGGFYWS